MNRSRLVLCLALAIGAHTAVAAEPKQNLAGSGFEKRVLTDKYYCDGITAGDTNRNGKVDVVAGPYWYEGPEFRTKHEFYPAQAFEVEEKPTDSMYSYVHDFNGDGWPDILVLGRVLFHEARWFENPRDTGGPWKR